MASGEEGIEVGAPEPVWGVVPGVVAGMAAGIDAAACASAAVISSELNRTCAGAWPGSLGCSNCSSFFSTDSTFAAAAAGDCGGATGAGFFNTRYSAATDVTKVATLMMRSSFHFMV